MPPTKIGVCGLDNLKQFHVIDIDNKLTLNDLNKSIPFTKKQGNVKCFIDHSGN